MWAVGVIMYSLISGEFPFQSKDQSGLIKKIKKGAYTKLDQISPYGIEVLEGLLQVDPDLRLTAS